MSNTKIPLEEKADKVIEWLEKGSDLFHKVQLHYFLGRSRQEVAVLAVLIKNSIEHDSPGLYKTIEDIVQKCIEEGHINHSTVRAEKEGNA